MAQSLISLITLATFVAAAPYAKRSGIIGEAPVTLSTRPGVVEPTGAPVITTATSPTLTTSCYPYVSQAGDTCESIGEQFGLTADAIFASNTFLDCENVWLDTPICVMIYEQISTTTVASPPQPSCNTYTSISGDTCESIGAEFGLTADEIYAANTFLDCQNIWANTPICIPVSQLTPTTFPILPPPPPATTSTPTICESIYTSQQGDTCDTLAILFHVFPATILGYNGFLSCDNIWANTRICVPPPDWAACALTYTSAEGDNCDTIGSKFGIPGNAVYEANTFLTCDNVWPWTQICIPYVL